MKGSMKIPKPTIKRLAVYYRCLADLLSDKIENTSSQEIADIIGIKASQVRKDLSYFGEFGKRGVGYDVRKLMEKLRDILGLQIAWNVAVIGSGNLGYAIANYPQLAQNGFNIIAAFDKDKKKIGKQIVKGVEVYDMKEIQRVFEEKKIEIAILTVPATVAQEVTDKLVKAGVRGILNFAPASLQVPEGVFAENADFVVGLKSLTFSIASIKNMNNTEETYTEEE